MNRTVRTIISSILTFFLTLCFAIIILLEGCTRGLFDEKLLKSSLIESKYDEYNYEEIVERIKTYVATADLPMEAIKEYLSYTQYYSNQLNYRTAVLAGKNSTIDYHEMEDELYHVLMEESNQTDDTEDAKYDLREIAADILMQYQKGIETEFFQSFYSYQTNIASIRRNATLTVGGVSVFFIIWLFFLYHSKYKPLRYITAALEAACICAIGMNGLFQGKVQKWIGEMGQGYYEQFLEVYANKITQYLWIELLIVMMIMAILIVVTNYVKKHQSIKMIR